MSNTPETTPTAEAGPSTPKTAENQAAAGNPPTVPQQIYTAVEVDSKLRKLDQSLRYDVVSTFQEFEKVLKRTRQELAQERLSRRESEDVAAMRINQLQAMVDEVTPRVGPQHRGAVHERRSGRDERLRQQWERMLWRD